MINNMMHAYDCVYTISCIYKCTLYPSLEPVNKANKVFLCMDTHHHGLHCHLLPSLLLFLFDSPQSLLLSCLHLSIYPLPLSLLLCLSCLFSLLLLNGCLSLLLLSHSLLLLLKGLSACRHQLTQLSSLNLSSLVRQLQLLKELWPVWYII